MAELPTGTVTFLFTDIEGSTRLWEEEPQAMKAALSRHDEILRDVIARHEGHVVKTTGDGFHAAFATAVDATGAAVMAQQMLGEEQWDLSRGLLVRIGIHTGAADVRDGDYYGTALNRASCRGSPPRSFPMGCPRASSCSLWARTGFVMSPSPSTCSRYWRPDCIGSFPHFRVRASDSGTCPPR
jgi:adenylate/guanylate cyclase family protein